MKDRRSIHHAPASNGGSDGENERRNSAERPFRRDRRRCGLCRAGDSGCDPHGAAPPRRCDRRCSTSRRLGEGRPRLGGCGGGLPHARPARLLGRDRAGSAGDHRHGDHRLAHVRSDPPRLSDFRRRGRARRTFRAHVGEPRAERRFAPARRARSVPCASGRDPTTTAISAASVPSAILSSRFCRVVPLPDNSTASRTGRSIGRQRKWLRR